MRHQQALSTASRRSSGTAATGATIAALSAGGLALMMLVGVVTRIRVLDSLAQTPPALVLMCLNLFIAWVALGPLGAATTTLGP